MTLRASSVTAEGGEIFSWDRANWQDLQVIGQILAERHPNIRIISLGDEGLAALVAALPELAQVAGHPDRYLLAAIAGAWITALEGEDDSSPYEYLA